MKDLQTELKELKNEIYDLYDTRPVLWTINEKPEILQKFDKITEIIDSKELKRRKIIDKLMEDGEIKWI